MNNTLLSATALAVTSLTTAANAAEWDVRVGGYYNAMVAYASTDSPAGTDFDGVDVATDAEIHFLPSITLDNGIRFGANIQLEGETTGDQIDESFVFIRGSFGEILLGSENSAGYLMHYSAPDVSFFNVNSNSLTTFIPYSGNISGGNTGNDIFRGTLGTTFIENNDNNDAARITYFTPRFAGFQLGTSYARDANEGNGPVNNNGRITDFFDIGANYVNSFGGFDVAVSGRWGIASDPFSGNNPQVWGAGINLGFAGLTIGGSFAEQNNTQASDGQAYDVGVSYETGPWAFSFTYFHGENVDNEHVPFGFKEELDRYILGVDYMLSQGVHLSAFGAYVDFDETLNDAAAPGGDDISGFVIGTGIRITF
jgi:predicted porin